MQTYLVTGAAGFIASKVCEMLLKTGNRVVGIDNLNNYYDVRLKDYRLGRLLNEDRWLKNSDFRNSLYKSKKKYCKDNFEFRPVDIEDLNALNDLFASFSFDAVFNLAARAGVRASIANPHVFLSTNTEGTLNILECQRKYNVKKQVLASTSSLYAGSPLPFTEDQAVNTPLSPYAAAKKAAELMAYSYHRIYNLDITVLRYFTVYGPAGRPDMAPFRFINWTLGNKDIEVYGNGAQSRDFTYVDDIARGTILAKKNLGYEIINLGGGNNPTSLAKLIQLIEKTSKIRARVKYLPTHAADVETTHASIQKAQHVLGWRPEFSTEEGVKLTVDWHMQNKELLKCLHVA